MTHRKILSPAFLLLFVLSLLCGTSAVFAQNRTITGRVAANDNDSTLPGVTVAVRGQRISTVTGRDGMFTLSVPPNATLVFSSVGYASLELAVGTNTNLNVHLVSTQLNLQQVVVIGYGTAKRKDLTGAVSSINADQIEKVPVTSLEQAMQGRAAGVQVTQNDGSPGANINVLIRGTGSIANNGNTPLYVVDGYPLETGGINNINPNDIATIDILKDASATAIYGIRAANGIVIVTTKKGLKNKVQVSLDMYVSSQSKPKQYDLLNAQDFAALSNEVEAADST